MDAVVSELLDIPVTHSEHPQVVRYPKEGGYYKPHMDTSDERLLMNTGPGRSQLEGERVSELHYALNLSTHGHLH